MKNYFYLLLLLFVSSLILANCGTGNEDEDENEKMTPSMSATIDGQEWNASSNIKAHFHENDGYLELNGTDATYGIDINIDATTTGTYSFKGTYESKALLSKTVDSLPKVYSTEVNSGQVTITEITSSVVKGTFYFTAYYTSLGNTDTVTVENGNFTYEYTSN
jgi:hypothetical protein